MFLPFLNQASAGVDPSVYLGANRIAGIASVGYSMSGRQRQFINPLLRYLRVQNLSSNLLFHLDPRVGLNNNFVRNSGVNVNTTSWSPYVNGGSATAPTLSIDTTNPFAGAGCIKIVCNGTYAFSGISQNIGSNTGTITVRGRVRGDAAFTFSYYYEVANNPQSTVAVGTAWQEFVFTTTATGGGTGTIYLGSTTPGTTFYLDNIEVIAGQPDQAYNERTDATVLKLNNSINNALGDGTLVNGTSTNMTTIDATAGEVLNYNNTLSQGIQTGLVSWIPDYTFIHWVKVPSLVANRVTIFKTATADRLIIQTDGAIRVSGNGTSVTSSTGAVVANTWAMITYTINSAGDVIIYKNGVQIGSGNNARLVDNAAAIFLGETSNAPFLGNIGEATLINSVLTSTQILAIYNIQKARYGL